MENGLFCKLIFFNDAASSIVKIYYLNCQKEQDSPIYGVRKSQSL